MASSITTFEYRASLRQLRVASVSMPEGMRQLILSVPTGLDGLDNEPRQKAGGSEQRGDSQGSRMVALASHWSLPQNANKDIEHT